MTDALHSAVGRGVLDSLTNLDPLAAIACSVCQVPKPAGTFEVMTVVAALDGDDHLVLGLAHNVCHEKVGDYWPGLLQDLHGGHSPEVDALAILGARESCWPGAYLLFEPRVVTRELLPGGDRRDLHVAAYLADGFTLAQACLEELVAPSAPGWQLCTGGGLLRLEHPEHGTILQHQLTGPALDWLKAAQGQGAALVVTGTHLGLAGLTEDDQALEHARSRGLLVAATIPLN